MKKAFSYVRYSSPGQAEGHSEERQTEAAEEWAKANDLELDDSTRLVERAKGAFYGKNIEPTAVLGSFLNDVRSGRIPPGSVLIVEAFDRLTRRPFFEAINVFRDIIQNEIELHILKNRQILTKEGLEKNPFQLAMCVMELCGGHSEIAGRADRVRKAWSKKKREASKDNPITARIPYWLKIENDKIVIDEEKAEVVRRIFDMRLAGKGRHLITKELNKNTKPFGEKTREWLPSYVQKILHNRAVLGEYQPYQKINDKRLPDGEVKPDYFPQVIDRDDFNSAQEKLRAGRLGGNGKTNGGVSNLFTSLVKCAYTTRQMWHTNKKSGTTWQYLTDRQGNVWNYNDFEKCFFQWVKEVEWFTLVNEERGRIRAEKKAAIEKLLKEKEELQRLSAKLLNAIENGIDFPDLKERAAKLKSDIERNKQELADARGKEQEAEKPALGMEEMEKAFLGDREKRLKLKAELRRHIQTIWVQPKERAFSVLFWSGKELHYSAKHKQGLTDWEALSEYIAN